MGQPSKMLERRLEVVSEELAQLQDKHEIQEKKFRQQMNEVLQTRMISAPTQSARNNNNFASMQRTGQQGGNGGGFKCHYCHIPGHFLDVCEHMLTDRAAGKIMFGQDRRLRWPDGTLVPREPSEKSLKEKVEMGQAKVTQLMVAEFEDYDYNIPGVIPMNGVNYNAQNHSMFLNLPYDRRDTIIDDLNKKLQAFQGQGHAIMQPSYDKPPELRAQSTETETLRLLQELQREFKAWKQTSSLSQKGQSGSSSGNSGF
jgi:hypothetical protein